MLLEDRQTRVVLPRRILETVCEERVERISAAEEDRNQEG